MFVVVVVAVVIPTYIFGHASLFYHGPGVNSAPSENEYQEHFLGVKAAGAWGWWPHHIHVPIVMKIWEPKHPGTLWATLSLLRYSCTSVFYVNCWEYVTLYGTQMIIYDMYNE